MKVIGLGGDRKGENGTQLPVDARHSLETQGRSHLPILRTPMAAAAAASVVVRFSHLKIEAGSLSTAVKSGPFAGGLGSELLHCVVPQELTFSCVCSVSWRLPGKEECAGA